MRRGLRNPTRAARDPSAEFILGGGGSLRVRLGGGGAAGNRGAIAGSESGARSSLPSAQASKQEAALASLMAQWASMSSMSRSRQHSESRRSPDRPRRAVVIMVQSASGVPQDAPARSSSCVRNARSKRALWAAIRVPPIIARKPGATSANRGAPRRSPAVRPWISLAPTSRSGSITVVQLAISSPQGDSRLDRSPRPDRRSATDRWSQHR